MRSPYSLKPALAVLTSIFAGLFISGCIFTTQNTKPAEAKPATPVEQPASVQTHKKPTAVYHDFEDVLVPVEMSVVKDRTVIVSTPGFRSGILTLKGRVDSTSLYNFFSINMEKDNWQVISKIKSPETTIMVYHKTERCAVITIRDEQIYTYAEIGVAPTLGGGMLQKSENLTY